MIKKIKKLIYSLNGIALEVYTMFKTNIKSVSNLISHDSTALEIF